ncbi:MAG: VOC family protein [Chloroflexota bacterium]|nr:VOC family protein [Chloroflexota bacterium]
MPNKPFRVQQVDHIELYVPDQYEAAKWYKEILGLEIMKDYEFWANEGGPLMISSDDGNTKLALFKGQPPGFMVPTGFKRVAFRVDGDGFFQFLNRLARHPVFGDTGERENKLEVVDHDRAYSLYFSDPFGNRYEVTTYDYTYVADRLNQNQP